MPPRLLNALLRKEWGRSCSREWEQGRMGPGRRGLIALYYLILTKN